MIGQWSNNPQFRDKTGRPRALTFEGKSSEFAELIASVSRELNPYAVLFDLERTGTVEKVDGRLSLLSAIYISAADLRTSMTFLANDLSELISAVEENVFDQPEVPNLHLKVHYDNLAQDELPALKRWLLKEGSEFTQRVQRHLSKFDKDINPALAKKPGGGRISMAVFGRTSGHR